MKKKALMETILDLQERHRILNHNFDLEQKDANEERNAAYHWHKQAQDLESRLEAAEHKAAAQKAVNGFIMFANMELISTLRRVVKFLGEDDDLLFFVGEPIQWIHDILADFGEDKE